MSNCFPQKVTYQSKEACFSGSKTPVKQKLRFLLPDLGVLERGTVYAKSEMRLKTNNLLMCPSRDGGVAMASWEQMGKNKNKNLKKERKKERSQPHKVMSWPKITGDTERRDGDTERRDASRVSRKPCISMETRPA